jgi:hypothetical protein
MSALLKTASHLADITTSAIRRSLRARAVSEARLSGAQTRGNREAHIGRLLQGEWRNFGLGIVPALCFFLGLVFAQKHAKEVA